MKKFFILFIILSFFIISCGDKTKKIVHLRYSSLDTIKTLPIIVNENGGTDQVTVFLSHLTENNLKKLKRFEFMDLNNWAMMRDEPNTVVKINKIHQEMKRVIIYFQNNKMEKSFDLSEKVLTILSGKFQFFEDLDEIFQLKSYQASSAMLSDVIDSERFFREIAVMDFNYDFDSNKFGPGILKQFKEARKEAKRFRKGTITVNSSPVTAKVFINGEYVGVTPYHSEKLRVGNQFVKVEADGFRPYGEVVKVQSRENPVDAILKNYSIHRELNLLRISLVTPPKKDEPKFPRTVLKFKRVIPFDQILFIKTRTVDSHIYVKVFVYDLPTTSLYKEGDFKLNLESDNLEEIYYNNLERILNY